MPQVEEECVECLEGQQDQKEAMFLSPGGNCCVRDLGQAGSRGKGQLKGGLRNQDGIFNDSMSRNVGKLRPSPPDTLPSN